MRLLSLITILVIGSGAGYRVRIWRAGHDLREARAAVHENRSDAAIAAYRRHLLRTPADTAVRLELAGVLKTRNPDAALKELRAVPLDRIEAESAARQIAVISLELGRDYDALGPLLWLVERRPEDPSLQLALAEIRFRAHDYEAALEHAQRRRELLPTEVDSYLLIADALDELKRPSEMVEPLQAALQIDPELAQAHLNLAYALQQIDRNDEARVHVEWFLHRHPDVAAAHRILALIERSEGNADVALASVREALRLQPHGFEANLLEVELLLYVRRADEAHLRLSELTKRFGDERRLLALQVQAAALSGRTDEARQFELRLKRLGGVD